MNKLDPVYIFYDYVYYKYVAYGLNWYFDRPAKKTFTVVKGYLSWYILYHSNYVCDSSNFEPFNQASESNDYKSFDSSLMIFDYRMNRYIMQKNTYWANNSSISTYNMDFNENMSKIYREGSIYLHLDCTR